MFERYTEKARRVIFFARYESSQFGSPEITTEHLLLAIFREDRALLKRLVPGLTSEIIRRRVEEHSPRGKKVSTSVDLPLSLPTQRTLTHAAEESERIGDRYIDTKHLLLGLTREADCLAAIILREQGLDLGQARKKLARGAAMAVERAQAQFARMAEEWGVLFHWERRRCEPQDALRNHVDQRLLLYRGEPYDAGQFELVKGGWKHFHCALCWQDLCAPADVEHRIGYTNGQDWLCASCYERYAAPVID